MGRPDARVPIGGPVAERRPTPLSPPPRPPTSSAIGAIRRRASPGEGRAGRPGRARAPRASGRGREARSAAASSSPAVSPGGLLLGLGGQPAGLRPELAEDVLDAGQVGLGLDQLLLGPPPPSLVAADAGDLLEQRPALLRPEGEGLVDHALADEQEGVVGEVGRVEQVDEVAEPDPAAG